MECSRPLALLICLLRKGGTSSLFLYTRLGDRNCRGPTAETERNYRATLRVARDGKEEPKIFMIDPQLLRLCINTTCCVTANDYRRKWITSQQKRKKITTPAQNTHLSCFALLSTIRMVSPLTPNVFATV